MKKTEVSHNHTQSQPSARQGGAALESPQGKQIAQLEAMMTESPQAEKLARLGAMMNCGPALATQRKIADTIHNSPRQLAQKKAFDAIHDSPAQVIQREKVESPFGAAQRQQAKAPQTEPSQRAETAPTPNNTGLPDNLKSGIESLSSLSMDAVRVHYNSSQPSQLNAHAYAQGTDIHVAPGQEQHLPHEAWHVVQQAQGRVLPTMQMKQGVPVNDDAGLEREADVMGERAVQMARGRHIIFAPVALGGRAAVTQRKWEYVDDTVMQWDQVRGGLEWYYSTDSRMMSFKIADRSFDYMRQLEQYKGKPRPYEEWIELWSENNWVQSMPVRLDTSQVFGTDIPQDGLALLGNLKEKSREEKIRILSDAMKAGYRRFDLAESYGTSDLIEEAAAAANVPVDELKLIYKLQPEKKGATGTLGEKVIEFKLRLSFLMQQIPAASEKVLMLHELPANPDDTETYIQALYDVAMQGDAGIVKSLGVSNVDSTMLDNICKFAARTGIMKVKYVENRFSPYEQDGAVRLYCAQNNITYMGFGLFGGSSTGFCSEGYAMPQRHLQALQDPRVLRLSRETEISPHALLLAWARQKGVATVVYSGSRAAENMKAQDMVLHERVIAELDSFFTYQEGKTDSKFISEGGGIKALYESIKDPTAWFVFDMLMSLPKVAVLFRQLFSAMHDKYGPGTGDKIKNVGQRVLRLVTHLQAMEKMGALEARWPEVMGAAFSTISDASSEDGVMRRLEEWTQKDYMEVGGATHAEENLKNIYSVEGPKIGDVIKVTSANGLTVVDDTFYEVKPEDAEKDSVLYCIYAPNGIAKQPKHKLTVKVLSGKVGEFTFEIMKLEAPGL